MSAADPLRLASRDHDAFNALPTERKQALIDAALETFGSTDYAHASTADIAQRAGMSKSLLFFYFKNKRELYLYLMDWLTERLTAFVIDDEYRSIDDFFELMHYAGTKKTDLFRRFPHALDFCVRAFYPRHRDVKNTMDRYLVTATDQLFDRYFSSIRWDRFRDDVDPRTVLDLLVWAADGYLHQCLRESRRIDLDDLIKRFDDWCTLMKRASYKEEYL